MRVRYSARAERFWYTIENCDRVLFVRTGGVDRGGVIDLLYKLKKHCQNKPFQLLILSLQDSHEFLELPHVLHYNVEFNPDRMYADRGHWLYCTEVMHGILQDLGVSSKNLFWCPPNPAQEMLA
jgi:predicted phosphoadenosine phosphosulfate sulfurtransferase